MFSDNLIFQAQYHQFIKTQIFPLPKKGVSVFLQVLKLKTNSKFYY